MSWNELERLVEEAEADGVIRRSLRHCRSREELVLASRRLGYRITRQDLGRAWCLHRRELEQDRRQAVQPGQVVSHPAAPAGASLARGEMTGMDLTVDATVSDRTVTRGTDTRGTVTDRTVTVGTATVGTATVGTVTDAILAS